MDAPIDEFEDEDNAAMDEFAEDEEQTVSARAKFELPIMPMTKLEEQMRQIKLTHFEHHIPNPTLIADANSEVTVPPTSAEQKFFGKAQKVMQSRARRTEALKAAESQSAAAAAAQAELDSKPHPLQGIQEKVNRARYQIDNMVSLLGQILKQDELTVAERQVASTAALNDGHCTPDQYRTLIMAKRAQLASNVSDVLGDGIAEMRQMVTATRTYHRDVSILRKSWRLVAASASNPPRPGEKKKLRLVGVDLSINPNRVAPPVTLFMRPDGHVTVPAPLLDQADMEGNDADAMVDEGEETGVSAVALVSSILSAEQRKTVNTEVYTRIKRDAAALSLSPDSPCTLILERHSVAARLQDGQTIEFLFFEGPKGPLTIRGTNVSDALAAKLGVDVFERVFRTNYIPRKQQQQQSLAARWSATNAELESRFVPQHDFSLVSNYDLRNCIVLSVINACAYHRLHEQISTLVVNTMKRAKQGHTVHVYESPDVDVFIATWSILKADGESCALLSLDKTELTLTVPRSNGRVEQYRNVRMSFLMSTLSMLVT